MTTTDMFAIAITLRNGQCFEHQYPREPKTKLYEFIKEIIDEMAKQHKVVLTLPYPLGIFRLDDVSSIRFLDIESDTKTIPIGFKHTISEA